MSDKSLSIAEWVTEPMTYWLKPLQLQYYRWRDSLKTFSLPHTVCCVVCMMIKFHETKLNRTRAWTAAIEHFYTKSPKDLLFQKVFRQRTSQKPPEQSYKADYHLNAQRSEVKYINYWKTKCSQGTSWDCHGARRSVHCPVLQNHAHLGVSQSFIETHLATFLEKITNAA